MPSQKVSSAYIDLELRTAAFKQAIGEATSSMRQFSAQTHEEMGKSRESVRLLSEELGLGIPRGLQGIISKLPGVTTAMNLAFDSVVVFALIAVVVKVTEKIEAFIKKNEEAAKKHADTWKEAARSVAGTTSALEVANSRIQDTIAKLEKEPGSNGLKTALLEASDEADKLSDKLDKDLQKISDVKVSTGLASLFGGGPSSADKVASTAAVRLQTLIESYRAPMRDASERGDTANYNQLRRDELHTIATDHQFNQSFTQLGEYLRTNQGLVGKHNQDFDNASNAFNIISGSVQSLNQQGDKELGSEKVRTLEDANAARSEHMKALQDEIAQREYQEPVKGDGDTGVIRKASLGEVALFWQQHVSDFAVGSKEYLEVEKNSKEASDKLMTDYWGAGKLKHIKVAEGSAPYQAPEKTPAGYTISPDGTLALVAKGDEALAAANAKAAESQAHINAEWTAASDKLGLLTGKVSPHEVAMHEEVAHTEEYRSQITALRVELQELAQDDDLIAALGGDPAHDAKESQVKQQIAEVQGKASVSRMNDDYAVRGTTVVGATITALDKLKQAFTNTADILSNTLIHSINSFNDTVVKVLTTPGYEHKNAFGELGHSIFTDVTKVSLQAAEGQTMKVVESIPGVKSVMDKLGLGSKRDGSSAQSALFVQEIGVAKDAGSTLSLFNSIYHKPNVVGPGSLGITATAAPLPDLSKLWLTPPPVLPSVNNWLDTDNALPLQPHQNFNDFSSYTANDHNAPWNSGTGTEAPSKAFSGDPIGLITNITNMATSKTGIEPGITKLLGLDNKMKVDAGLVKLDPATIAALAQAVGVSRATVGSGVIPSAPAGLAGLLSTLSGGSTSATSTLAAAQSGVADISTMALDLGLIGMAGGGVMSAGDFYLTGEQGPELIQVGSTSKINNARDTSNIFNGGGGPRSQHNINIDARGANDPSAAAMAVHRAMGQYLPHLGPAAEAHMRDSRSRAPSRSR